MADLWKKYLRDLPRPVIPEESFFGNFLLSKNINDPLLYQSYLTALVRSLPVDHFELLRFMCKFFKEIDSHSETTKMGSSNLSIIFGPLIFGQTETTDSMRLVLEAQTTSKITQTMIDHSDDIFSRDSAPAITMLVQESYVDQEISLLKGETVTVLHIRSSKDPEPLIDECYVTVAGKILRTQRSLIESKCKPSKAVLDNDYLRVLDKRIITQVRNDALSRLLGKDEAQTITVGKSKPKPAPSKDGSVSPNPPSPSLKKAITTAKPITRKRRKSELVSNHFDMIAPSVVTPSPEEGSGSGSPPTQSKKKEKGEKPEKPSKKEKPEKVEKATEKVDKKKQKQIDSALTSWYGAPSTRSSGGFFSIPRNPVRRTRGPDV